MPGSVLPNFGRANIQFFNGAQIITGLEVDVWIKPKRSKYTMCYILAVGGGGSGGKGFGAGVGTGRGGGSGGGSGGQTRWMGPLHMLPDKLSLQLGRGGFDAANSGRDTYVAIGNLGSGPSIPNILLRAKGGLSGQDGTSGAGGSSSAGGSITLAADQPMSRIGRWQSVAGQTSSTGGGSAGAVGNPISTQTTSSFVYAGSAGAGTTSADFAGGGYTATANAYISEFPSPTGGAAGSNPGNGGIVVWQPLTVFGGTGGGSSNSTVGGNGGHGIMGSGGGGGGGGVTTGGQGGNGGPGFVYIICFG